MDWFNISLKLPITDPTWIFLLVLLIILFAPILLNRLRIPHIIGMILAGVVIGEHGFNLLVRDSSFELFGKVGLYYIMFLAGLEMNMGDFKKNSLKALVLGLLAFIVPIAIGFAASSLVLHYGLLTCIMISCMYSSQTLVSYPIVIRYGVSRQRCVSISVGGTAITDTLTLLLLAGISSMCRGEVDGMFGVWLVLKFLLLGGGIVYLFPRIGRWFFRRYDDHVMQFIYVLANVFLGAGLMELVGMEGILGAFLVGLVLNHLIPHVSPLMSHLEFVGNALFIPYFLIGVGMLINLNVIFGGGNALLIAAVMVAVAMAGKWTACWMTQKLFHMKKVERSLMFGLSSSHAAATLAAVLVGYNIILPDGNRLINDEVLNGTVLLILVSCVWSSLVTEKAARKMALLEEAHIEEEGTQEEERILIPIANPDTIEDLVNLSLVIRDAKQRNNLVAMTVINDNTASDTAEQHSKRNLEKAARITAAADVPLQRITRYDTNIASGIIHTAKEYAATDVIIGLHRKANLVDSFFGIVTESLLKGLHREVMISKFLIPINTIRRVIVAVPAKAEYEPGFAKWVEHFSRLGDTLGCRVHFYANEETTSCLKGFIQRKYPQTRTEFSILEEWDDLLLLTGQVNYDHLLVIITARRGSISYQSSFERLPQQIGRYFANNSLIMLYPDQLGEPQEIVSINNPRLMAEARTYNKMGDWLYKWFKKRTDNLDTHSI